MFLCFTFLEGLEQMKKKNAHCWNEWKDVTFVETIEYGIQTFLKFCMMNINNHDNKILFG